MNANENIRNDDTPEDVIELGVASIETKGLTGVTENHGIDSLGGISDA